MRKNEKLHEAIVFAAKAHKGQLRKGTDVDYISHPLEAMQILTAMGADEDLIVAGILHDTVEDTGVPMQEITERFGNDVAQLIQGHTEDKSKSWEDRKQSMIDAVAAGDLRLKMLVLSDLLSNMRSTWSDYRIHGDDAWKKFNAPKEKQFWYYSAVLKAVRKLEEHEETRGAYWEATELYKDMYGSNLLAEG